MPLTYLFDASSLVRALKEARLVPLGGQAIQWLTVYEVLNALWKEVYLLHKLSPKEAISITSDFEELVRNMVVLEPSGLEQEVLQIAVSKGVTAYDASYIALAKRHGLVLVTEDKKLRKAASGIVESISLDAIV